MSLQPALSPKRAAGRAEWGAVLSKNDERGGTVLHILCRCIVWGRNFPSDSMNTMKQMKDMYRIQRDAKRIKKELKNIHVEAEAEGVTVVMNAEQEVLDIVIQETVDRSRLPALLKDAFNRCTKKAQIVAAEKMQSVMQQMGIPTGGGLQE